MSPIIAPSGQSGGGSVPFVGVDPPGSPTDGELWWDPDDDAPVNNDSLVTRTTTVPAAWILAHSTGDAAFEVVPAQAGKTITVLGGSVRLRFNSAPYTGATADTDIFLFSGIDAGSGLEDFDTIPDNFWDATSDVAVRIASATATHQPDSLGQPWSLGLLGAGLADGDSDIEVTVYYIAK